MPNRLPIKSQRISRSLRKTAYDSHPLSWSIVLVADLSAPICMGAFILTQPQQILYKKVM